MTYNLELEQEIAKLARQVQKERERMRNGQNQPLDPRLTTDADAKKFVKQLTREKTNLESRLSWSLGSTTA